ncbi:MAG: peptide chain release factor N(5)-glutamine methyltransferase [Methylococcales bacterium]
MCSAPICSIGAALEDAAAQLQSKSTSARLDAEILLGQVLGKSRSFLRAWPETRLDTVQIDHFRKQIESRKIGMPIAYLTGCREFWSRRYSVSRDVLIPRSETELLVEMALEMIPRDEPCAILELGTGSGIIAVSLALERPKASILATDISPAALELARQNATRHRAANIQFLKSNWFESIPNTKVDLVISNPPYVASEDPHLAAGDLVFEPEIALKSGPSGMEALELIASETRKWLKPGGGLLLEHGCQQSSELSRMLQRYGYQDIDTRTDLQDHPRATQSLWSGNIPGSEFISS